MAESQSDILIRRFFPYSSFRPHQHEAIKFAFNIFMNGRIGLLSSPCGTGKSISILTAYFIARMLNKSVGRLLVMSRTRNQLEIYCRELKRIKEHAGINFTASVFKSKMDMCPQLRENPKLKDMSYRDFLHYCRDLRKGIRGENCEYYDRTYRGWKPSRHAWRVINEIRENGPLLPDEVYEICRSYRVCPYEVTKILAGYSDIIIGNYNYMLVPQVRRNILGRSRIRMKDLNCVFDEAHSLPYYAVGMLSDELSSLTVDRAVNEAEHYNVDDHGLLESLYDMMDKLGKLVFENYGLDTEHVVGRDDVIKMLTDSLRLDFDALYSIILVLIEAGEEIRNEKFRGGRRPVSYISRCMEFLQKWMNLKGSGYIRYIKTLIYRGERNVKIGIKCIDPSAATNVINKLRSALLMSGTLWHKDYYIDILGLDRGRCDYVELPSPFPHENRLIIVDMAVTTKFEERVEEEWRRIAEHIEKFIEKIGRRTAVYFPSYEVMHNVLNKLDLNAPYIVEGRETSIVDVLNFLESNKHSILFGVARGKISEGVDMTVSGRSMLSAIIIVGLPYPKKTELHEELIKYFMEKYKDRALEYANDIPCLNALAQSAGRLIRNPEDRGIIILMDRRAAGKFKQKLPGEWKYELKAHKKIERILKRIENFY